MRIKQSYDEYLVKITADSQCHSPVDKPSFADLETKLKVQEEALRMEKEKNAALEQAEKKKQVERANLEQSMAKAVEDLA